MPVIKALKADQPAASDGGQLECWRIVGSDRRALTAPRALRMARLDERYVLLVIRHASRVRADALANLPISGKVATAKSGMWPYRQQTGFQPQIQPSSVNRRRVFYVDQQATSLADCDQATATAVPWSEVPEFARHLVVWMEGRLGPAQASLPTVEVEPVPEILYWLPHFHPVRPRGSKPMLDCAGAKARLRDMRPGAWLVSPFTGWKWAKWPGSEVGWLPAEAQLPDCFRVQERNDVQ
jgi:hypothetical protein